MKYFKTESTVVAAREDAPELLRLSRQLDRWFMLEHQAFNEVGATAVAEHLEKRSDEPVSKTSRIGRDEFLAELDRSMVVIREFRERILNHNNEALV